MIRFGGLFLFHRFFHFFLNFNYHRDLLVKFSNDLFGNNSILNNFDSLLLDFLLMLNYFLNNFQLRFLFFLEHLCKHEHLFFTKLFLTQNLHDWIFTCFLLLFTLFNNLFEKLSDFCSFRLLNFRKLLLFFRLGFRLFLRLRLSFLDFTNIVGIFDESQVFVRVP